MNRMFGILGLSTIACAVACGSADNSSGASTTTNESVAVVSGALTGAANVPGLRVIAKGENGRLIWTNVDSQGRFALSVPKSVAYRLLLAKVTAAGTSQVVGHLALRTSAGKSLWMVPDTSIALGRVARVGELPVAGSVGTLSDRDEDKCERCESESEDKDDDKEDRSCHEEEEKEDSLCKCGSGDSGDKDEELEAENDPGDKCAKKGSSDDDTDDDGKADKDDDEQDDIKRCSAAGGGATTPPTNPPPPANPPPPPPPAGPTPPA